MSIYPKLDLEDVSIGEVSEYREWAFDFENNRLKTLGGRYYTVSGQEALKIWIYKVLGAKKGRFPAYTSEFGSELEEVIGLGDRELIESEIIRLLNEALIGDYVLELLDFEFDYSGDACAVTFIVKSVYGEFEFMTEVES